jgi:hypothetical protein
MPAMHGVLLRVQSVVFARVPAAYCNECCARQNLPGKKIRARATQRIARCSHDKKVRRRNRPLQIFSARVRKRT